MKKLLSNVEDPFQIIFPRSGCEKSICKQLVFQFCFSLLSISCPMSYVNAFGFGRNMTFGGYEYGLSNFSFEVNVRMLSERKRDHCNHHQYPIKNVVDQYIYLIYFSAHNFLGFYPHGGQACITICLLSIRWFFAFARWSISSIVLYIQLSCLTSIQLQQVVRSLVQIASLMCLRVSNSIKSGQAIHIFLKKTMSSNLRPYIRLVFFMRSQRLFHFTVTIS